MCSRIQVRLTDLPAISEMRSPAMITPSTAMSRRAIGDSSRRIHWQAAPMGTTRGAGTGMLTSVAIRPIGLIRPACVTRSTPAAHFPLPAEALLLSRGRSAATHAKTSSMPQTGTQWPRRCLASIAMVSPGREGAAAVGLVAEVPVACRGTLFRRQR
jgi:hypothetical protein